MVDQLKAQYDETVRSLAMQNEPKAKQTVYFFGIWSDFYAKLVQRQEVEARRAASTRRGSVGKGKGGAQRV